MTEVLLYLAPALLIFVPLLRGRYIGERRIRRLASRRALPPRRLAPAPDRPLPRAPEDLRLRGPALIAFSLAKRPPPPRLLPQN